MVDKLLQYFTSSEGYSYSHMMLIFLVICAVSFYIFIIYRITAKATVYSKTYGITVGGIGIITCGIIIAMQSSFAIALGMVGALSIVRFRTAIKDPLDLLFLFWAVGEGIICGSDLLGLAPLLCLVMTAALLIFNKFPIKRAPYLLIVNAKTRAVEDALEQVLKNAKCAYRVKSKNITQRSVDMIVELRAKNANAILDEALKIEGVENVSLLSHDGETRF